MKRLLLSWLFAGAMLAPAFALEDPRPSPPSPAHVRTDAEIQSAVVKGIIANPEVFAAKLRVEATGGVVTLRGSVRDGEARKAAEKIARAVPGVRVVRNRLLVRRSTR